MRAVFSFCALQFVLLAWLSFSTSAQTPFPYNLEWGFTYELSNRGDVYNSSTQNYLAADALGNVFVSCTFIDTLQDIDPDPNQSYNVGSGGAPFHTGRKFVAKYDLNKNFKWGFYLNSARPIAIDADSAGNLYAAFYHHGQTEVFLPFEQPIVSDPGIILLKLDRSGNLQWLKNLTQVNGTPWYDLSISVKNNRVLISALFQGAIQTDPENGNGLVTSYEITPQEPNDIDILVAKYTDNGQLLNSFKLEGKFSINSSLAPDIEIMPDGQFFLSFYTEDEVDLDPSNQTFWVGSDCQTDAFLAKYDAQGNLILGKDFGSCSSLHNVFPKITLDRNNLWLFTGYQGAGINLSSAANPVELPTSDGTTGVIVKYNLSGELQSYVSLRANHSSEFVRPDHIEADGKGNIFVLGTARGTNLEWNGRGQSRQETFNDGKFAFLGSYNSNLILRELWGYGSANKFFPSGLQAVSDSVLFASFNMRQSFSFDADPSPDFYILRSNQGGANVPVLKFVNPCEIKYGNLTIEQCDSYTVPSGDETYTQSGVYQDTLITPAGCDSILQIDLTILHPDSSFQTVIACDPYTWTENGVVYENSGTYYVDLVGRDRCDSTLVLQLTVHSSQEQTQTIVACNTYTWSVNNQTYVQGGRYEASFIDQHGCDSTLVLDLSLHESTIQHEMVVLCDQANYLWDVNGQTYNADGVYSAIFVNQYGCDSTHTLDIKFHSSDAVSQSVAACEQYTWEVNNTTYFSSGSYSYTLANRFGCDSVLTLNLTINNPTSGSETVSACENYRWETSGQTYFSSGNYQTTLMNAQGCDSTVTLNLTIRRAEEHVTTVDRCDANFTWSETGQTYVTSGTYRKRYTNRFGCDSTEVLVLNLYESNGGAENTTVCNSFIWSANGVTYTASGSYQTVLTNKNGCDSTATLNLTVHNSNSGTEDVVACDVFLWEANTTTYNASGTYTTTLINKWGCDSTATLNLTINASNGSETAITACDHYLWPENGVNYTTSGVYTHTLTNKFGCDSTLTLNLEVNKSNGGTEFVTACEPYTWSANNVTYTSTGIYTAQLQNQKGCDSTATLRLTINNHNAGSESITACDTYYWSANGLTYTQSGSYTSQLQNQFGCDSLATLNLTINASNGSVQDVVACDRYLWEENNRTYTQGGTFYHILQNQMGCDSIISLNLTLNRSNGSVQFAAQCEGPYVWEENGQSYNQSGSYNHVLQNRNGCDSVLTLNLSIHPAEEATDIQFACDSFLWNANGMWYYQSGTDQAMLQTVQGCDSVVQLNLTLHTADSVFQNVTACDTYTWPSNGLTYTQSGRYLHQLHNVNGCDSTQVLDLIIHPSHTQTEQISSCGQFTWGANGETYFQSGQYTTVLQNQHGCDSTVTLDLNILQPSFATQTETACNSFQWHINGKSYSQSGNYTDTIPNRMGCDSIVSLDLILNYSDTTTEQVITCENYTWPANNVTYSQSGNYSHVLQNQFGCDSLVLLNLTLHSNFASFDYVTQCDGPYTWPANGQSYSASGTHTAILQSRNGCDSVVTLNLTIHPSNAGGEEVAACNSYTWLANNTTYSTTGVYTAQLQNQYGCDSLATLDLTIHHNNAGSQNVTACERYFWASTSTTYTRSGSYQAVLQNQFGCDSTATLNLTVLPVQSTLQHVTICEGEYYWPDGDTLIFEAGRFTTTLVAQNGCDSVVTLDLEMVEVDLEYWMEEGFIYAPLGNETHQWRICAADGTCQDLGLANAPKIYPPRNGEYQLIVSTDVCTDTLLIPYTDYYCEQPFYIPNSFSPNGDGINDVFEVKQAGCPITNFEIQVFNRWGERVYQSNQPDFKWSGRYKNQPIKPGVYNYLLNFGVDDFTGSFQKTLNGTVSVIR